MHTKQILAWTAVVYVVAANLLIFYLIATGEMISGITGLMLLPALACAGALAVDQHRAGRMFPSAWSLVLALAFCVVAFAFCLYTGVGELTAALAQ